MSAAVSIAAAVLQSSNCPMAAVHDAAARGQTCRCAGSALDLESLCLASGKTCWVIFVDGLVLNADGSVVDALSIAAKARTLCLLLAYSVI